MHKHHGFSLIGIVIIIAVVGVIGLIIWRVYDANTKQPTPQQSSAPTQATPTDAKPTTQTYTSTLDKFTFQYPMDWKVEPQESNDGEQMILNSPNLVAPEQPIGGTYVEKGGSITISAYPCTESCSIDHVYDGRIMDISTSSRTTTTIGGIPAARFVLAYESQPTLVTQFYHNDYEYSVYFATEGNDFNNSYRAALDMVVNSFTFK